MFKRAMLIFTVIFLATSMLSGCWDKVEIDQRGFVEVVMIDPAPPGSEEEIGEAAKEIPGISMQQSDMIKVTYVFPNTGLLAGQGGGGGNESGFTSLLSVAENISKANRLVDARVSRRLYFGHTQIIILSQELFKNTKKTKEVIDYLRRDPQFNRTIRLLITDGDASKIAGIKPKVEKLLFRYINGIIDNEDTNGRIIDINLTEFIAMITQPEATAIIPKVSVKGDELKISGAAVIKDFKLSGYISEYESLYFNTLQGTRSGGVESVNFEGSSVEFTSNNTTRKLELLNSDPNNLEIEIDVKIEGILMGSEFDKELFDADTINKIEREFNKMSDESCRLVIKKLQKEYKADALSISAYLRKFHPDIWDKVKERWEEIYSNIKITPRMDYRIRRIGTVK